MSNKQLPEAEQNQRQQEDDFFDALTNAPIPSNPAAEEAERKREEMRAKMEIKAKQEKKASKVEKTAAEKFEEELINNSATPEEPVVEETPSINEHAKDALASLQEAGKIEPEEPAESKRGQTESFVTLDEHPFVPEEPKKPKAERNIEILTPTQVENEEARKNDTVKTPETKLAARDNLTADNLDDRLYEQNRDIAATNPNDSNNDKVEEITVSDVNNIIENEYEDTKDAEETKIDVTIDTSDKAEVIEPEVTEPKKQEPRERAPIQYYGGDGSQSSFKLRTSKVTKIARQVKIDDTNAVRAVDISKKPLSEQQNIYLNTVLPTLQPSYVVVPFIISGVVITMTAFTWPDIKDICLIEEKVYDTLNPDDDDYIYEKNKAFLEKRRKEIDLFYNHIFSVSGYETKPSKEDLFGKIIKFPDFQQLFFAAYAASFQKPYTFTLVCAACGTEQEKSVTPKELCFLLNKNININQLNHYIEHGSMLKPQDTNELYGEFQKEKIVQMSNSIYRIEKKLPVSSFMYDMKIPTVYEALDTLDEIVETFRTRPLEYTDSEGTTVSVDSSFGLTPELMELRAYLYFKALIATQVVSEDKATNSAKVGFLSFTEKNAIISSIYNLSSEDYKQLMSDETLGKLVRVSGIRHAIKAGVCTEPTCKSDMGIISVEPEQLFFTIARRDLSN